MWHAQAYLHTPRTLPPTPCGTSIIFCWQPTPSCSPLGCCVVALEAHTYSHLGTSCARVCVNKLHADTPFHRKMRQSTMNMPRKARALKTNWIELKWNETLIQSTHGRDAISISRSRQLRCVPLERAVASSHTCTHPHEYRWHIQCLVRRTGWWRRCGVWRRSENVPWCNQKKTARVVFRKVRQASAHVCDVVVFEEIDMWPMGMEKMTANDIASNRNTEPPTLPTPCGCMEAKSNLQSFVIESV